MCGITGSVSFEKKIIRGLEDLKKFTSFLKFRGPDAEGYYFETLNNVHLAFGHRRLSIIDLEPSANQPMFSFSGKSLITFNGEIYNYESLKSELIQSGLRFKTKSDTEVLLNGFEKWGMETLLKKIDGMFAFALYDLTDESLYLARDGFGKKPLYYCYNSSEKQLSFSSDIRSFKSVGISLSIDFHALGYYFSEMSTPQENSIYSEIKKLKPAAFMKFDRKGLSSTTYWNLEYQPKQKWARSEIIDSAESLLSNAVKKRMVSDVGYSAFLSGGIDSSLVTAILALNSSKPVNTYTVGSGEKEFNEIPFARKVAEKYGTNHHEIILNPNDMILVDDILEEYGEPFADSSSIPTYYICKEVSKSEKVILSGDGGDELFAGYYDYYYADRVEKFRNAGFLLPVLNAFPLKSDKIRFLKELLNSNRSSPEQLLHRQGMGYSTAELKRLCNNPMFYGSLDKELKSVWKAYSDPSYSLLDNVLRSSLHTRLVNDYLVKVDRASMYNSLEVRSPFLDKQLAEFASKIDRNQLLHRGITKSITKEIAEKLLPADDVHRPKQGFSIPIGKWIRNELRTNTLAVFNDTKCDFIDKKFAGEILKRHLEGENLSARVWTLYVFYKWIENHL
jgi:asparagine synthase (glutamine-hydrolysing)